MANQNRKKSPKKLMKTPNPQSNLSPSGLTPKLRDLEANTLEDLSEESLSVLSGGTCPSSPWNIKLVASWDKEGNMIIRADPAECISILERESFDETPTSFDFDAAQKEFPSFDFGSHT